MKFYFTILLVCSLTYSFAQDYKFSQFYNTPQHVNPAWTGFLEGGSRVYAVYRSQWNSILEDNAYETIGLSYDTRVNVYGKDQLGLGIIGVVDRVGSSEGKYSQNSIFLSSSYIKMLNSNAYGSQKSYLIVGLQIGFGKNQFDVTDAWFSSQFNNTSFTIDQSIASGENLSDGSRLYFDSHVGLTYYNKPNDRFSFYIGGAYHHINKPIIFYRGQRDFVFPKISGQIGTEIYFNDELSTVISTLVQKQGPSLSIQGGSSIKYSNGDWNEIAMRIGAWVNVVNNIEAIGPDAVTVSAQLEVESLIVGISYDINISQLSDYTDSRGALELTGIYRLPSNQRAKVINPVF